MRLAVIAVVLSTSTGCAFMFKGGKQDVRIASVPRESDVRVDGRYLGETPLDTELDRDRAQNIVVTKEGFSEQRVHIKRQSDIPWFFWDIATCVVPVTLCIPLLADAISGAWYSYDDEYRVKLDPVPVAPKAPAPPETQPPPPAPTSTTLGF